jgi:hypothetical protein
MARAFALSPDILGTTGDSVVFTSRVQFIGTDLPNGPDASVITFQVNPGDTAATIRDAFVAAIKAEGQRLTYALPNNSILIPAFIKI